MSHCCDGAAGERLRVAPLHAAVLERAGAGTLLDLGCGNGEFARYATDRGATVTGVDVDRVAIAEAAARVPEATFLVGDAADPPPGPFAAVVAVQLLEHVVNPVAVLRAAPAPVVVATVWGRESECDARSSPRRWRPGCRRAHRGRARRP